MRVLIMKRLYLILYFTLFLISNSYAQHIKLIGNIRDTLSKEIIFNATIEVFSAKRVISQTFSDKCGNYHLIVNPQREELEIKINLENYRPYHFFIKPNYKMATRDSEIYLDTVGLRRSVVVLKEVKIKRNKRYSDTLFIDLSRKFFERSVMIDDMLSQHGLSKSSTGQLYYKGKPVTDLLVNGGDFFGKNNLSIYDKLPALIVDGVEIVETTIDSTTNVTMLNPTVKVNLRLKEKYKQGKFGNANLGIGTQKRFVGSADMYAYKNDEQISSSVNSNNINLESNQLSEPNIMFSANGNNNIAHSAKVFYRNVFWKKLEMNVALNGKIENSFVESQSERKNELNSQFSSTFNRSKIRSLSTDRSNIDINYRLDPQNVIRANFALGYVNSHQNDSLNYNIFLNGEATNAGLKREKEQVKYTTSLYTIYTKTFTQKKGRVWNTNIYLDKIKHTITEYNFISNLSKGRNEKVNLNGERIASEGRFNINTNFTEPLSDSGSLTMFLDYKNQNINYNSLIEADTAKQSLKAIDLVISHFFNPGLTFQQNGNKIGLTGIVGGVLNLRTYPYSTRLDASFYNLDLDLKGDFKLSPKNNLAAKYLLKPNYPTINQLTSITNSFDLIAQNSGNVNLKPEVKQEVGVTYEFKKSDSLQIYFNAQAQFYSSKFGYRISSLTDNLQQTTIENIGKTFSANGSVTLIYQIKNGLTINYTNSVNYQQTPLITNELRSISSGVTILQTFSTNKELLKNILNISPIFSLSNSRFNYENASSKTLGFTYADKYALRLGRTELNIFPFFNLNKGFDRTVTWAMNGEIKMNFLKNYSSAWLKMYDIFNSFKYVNNINGGLYTENLKYTNIRRYLLLGLSFKFNNMK